MSPYPLLGKKYEQRNSTFKSWWLTILNQSIFFPFSCYHPRSPIFCLAALITPLLFYGSDFTKQPTGIWLFVPVNVVYLHPSTPSVLQLTEFLTDELTLKGGLARDISSSWIAFPQIFTASPSPCGYWRLLKIPPSRGLSWSPGPRMFPTPYYHVTLLCFYYFFHVTYLLSTYFALRRATQSSSYAQWSCIPVKGNTQ